MKHPRVTTAGQKNCPYQREDLQSPLGPNTITCMFNWMTDTAVIRQAHEFFSERIIMLIFIMHYYAAPLCGTGLRSRGFLVQAPVQKQMDGLPVVRGGARTPSELCHCTLEQATEPSKAHRGPCLHILWLSKRN